MLKRRPLLAAGLLWLATTALAEDFPSPASCDLNAGEWEQVSCLLAPVKTYGMLESPRKSLPEPWKRLFLEQREALPSPGSFRAYLHQAGIQERDIGGALEQPISQNSYGETARYLIIHDTSTLLEPSRKSNFPAFTNARGWSDNKLRILERKKNAHIFIGRTGQSSTAVDLGEALLTTKFEKTSRERLEGLFIGVENLQPRRLDGRGIDSIAPSPGFTPAQMNRLAVVYVAASIRAGRWLIPAFHAVLDKGIPNAHDDPQHFDLARFSAALDKVLAETRKRPRTKLALEQMEQ